MAHKQWEPVEVLAESVRQGKTTATSLIERSLSAISEKQEYNAIILVLKDQALRRAKQIDDLVSSGKDAGRLAGVPFIVKDNFLIKDTETTAASNILRNFNAPYTASTVDKLEKEGAICVAKANLDAFAHGASTENSDFFVTKNPYDKTRVSGGSSGGSAAAVSLGLVPFALGTDTGGSIRQPSAFCNVFGLKPTYGLVSRSGVVAMGSSLDVVGPITNNVKDAALILDIISGIDRLDSTTIPSAAEGYSDISKLSLKGVKIGLIKEYMDDEVSGTIKDAVTDCLDELKDAGASVKEISLPSIGLALASYYIICPAEVSSNLSRYDGQRYGYNDPKAADLNESYVNARGKGFGKEAKRRIMIGTFVLSSGYYDAYYKKAMTARSKLIDEFNHAFNQVDYLVGPVTPSLPFKIGEKSKNPLDMYLADVMTVAANLVGIPAASIPIGFSEDKLPIGFQVMAPQREDRKLLEMSLVVEGINV